MKIAVTYDNGNVFQHFGRTEQFKVYEVEDNKVVSSEVIGSGGTGHGALAGLLAGQDVDVLICGGIGGTRRPRRTSGRTGRGCTDLRRHRRRGTGGSRGSRRGTVRRRRGKYRRSSGSISQRRAGIHRRQLRPSSRRRPRLHRRQLRPSSRRRARLRRS